MGVMSRERPRSRKRRPSRAPTRADRLWEQRFRQLRAFKRRHRHCNVPYRWRPNPALGQWVARQRRRHRLGRLEAHRVQRLERLGLAWLPLEARWEQRLGELERFHAAHGHCRVPSAWARNPALANWVKQQRLAYWDGTLDTRRRRRLARLGFDWAPHETIWETRMRELRAYRREHGDCDVPVSYPANPDLGAWVHEQRQLWREGRLAQERVDRLESLDFNWSVSDALWERHFQEWVQFRKRAGHGNVPRTWQESPLGLWVRSQRRLRREGELPPDRERRLTRAGFVWEPRDDAWESQFAKLAKFKRRHGHTRVPARWSQDRELGRWVRRQREMRRDGTLDSDRRRRLDRMGFDWDPGRDLTYQTQLWEARYAELRTFKARFGHTSVPQRFPANPSLGRWVNKQRVLRRQGRLERGRERRLRKLGFAWEAPRSSAH